MEDRDDEPGPMPLRTPRNAPRPLKPTKAKLTNQKRRKMPVFESDDEESIELFDLDEEEENCTGLDSEDDETRQTERIPVAANRMVWNHRARESEDDSDGVVHDSASVFFLLLSSL